MVAAGGFLLVVAAGCPWVWWGFVEGFEFFFSSLLRFLNLEFGMSGILQCGQIIK